MPVLKIHDEFMQRQVKILGALILLGLLHFGGRSPGTALSQSGCLPSMPLKAYSFLTISNMASKAWLYFMSGKIFHGCICRFVQGHLHTGILQEKEGILVKIHNGIAGRHACYRVIGCKEQPVRTKPGGNCWSPSGAQISSLPPFTSSSFSRSMVTEAR